MLYDIGLRITYSYATPAGGGRHILYMTPADLPGQQRAITSLLKITPAPDERIARTDFYGNTLVEAVFRAPHANIEFKLRARVERQAWGRPNDRSPPLEGLAREMVAMKSLAPDAPHHFMGDSPRIRVALEFGAYARAQLAQGMTVLAAVEAIGRAIDRDMKFDPDATDAHTPPEEAFAARHGVCQDFSHIMIGCLRAIGVPAGYVSGFLRTNPPPGQPRLEGADAMHAWVRAWCGAQVGWVEYDPTNGIFAGPDHIVVAYGRDYGDVAPVRGVVRISGGQTSTQAVDVVPLP
ncbi:MAG TPA: transglutaminase family protein [Hyphomonadaceae bacterium]|jgi:transglutaminase-like putative cysteine protease|nr:transglutaminase family protein [Hyphomonadaceae bacterium]